MKDILNTLAAKIDPASINVSDQSAGDTIVNIMNLVYYAAGAVAVIVIIVAGFMMVLQGNNPEKIAKRKNAITYGVIGLVIVMLAFTITQWIVGRF